jgi:hypothetical protein
MWQFTSIDPNINHKTIFIETYECSGNGEKRNHKGFWMIKKITFSGIIRGRALCNRAAPRPGPSYPKPSQQEAHIMIPLVRLRGWFIHWMNILFLIHWQSVLSKRSLITLWSLLCASMDLSFTGWRACSSPTDNPCCPSEAYFHLLRIMCFSFFLFFSL